MPKKPKTAYSLPMPEGRQHWTHFLPEAGTIIDAGYKQQYRVQDMARLLREFEALRAEFEAEEKSLTALATGPDMWSTTEVVTAKLLAQTHGTKAAYQEYVNQLFAERS